jgi:hypothetical protein
MKTYTIILALVLIATSTTHSQDKTIRYFGGAERYRYMNTTVVDQRYLASLNNSNDGVVESALAHIARLKLEVPVSSDEFLSTRVADIAKTSSSPEIRYKAFLTGTVLNNPELFHTMELGQYDSPDELFAALASRLSEYYTSR